MAAPRTLRVFIGCPGDMAPERDALMELEKFESSFHAPVKFKTWKTTAPGVGDPQRVIFGDDPPESFDIVVILIWKRLGVPSGYQHPVTGAELTGTEAEFVLSLKEHQDGNGAKPQILLYRCTRKAELDVTASDIAEQAAQLQAVQRFFESTGTGKSDAVLAQSFDTAESLRTRFPSDLNIAIGRLRGASKKQAASAGKVAGTARKAINWAAAEDAYRRHLIDSHRIVKFHTAEARAPVEVELEKVFIKLLAEQRQATHPALVPWEDLPEAFRAFEREQATRPAGIHARDRQAQELIAQASHAQWVKDRTAEGWTYGPVRTIPTSQPTSLPDLLRAQNHLALSGSPGSGKTTLLQYLVLTFARGKQRELFSLEEERLPVLVRLRQFFLWVERQRHEKKIDELKPAHFHQFLAAAWQQDVVGQAPRLPHSSPAGGAPALQSPGAPQRSGAPELPAKFFERLLSDPRALILLDGLDEIADPAQRREIAALVARALDDWRDARVILTSRPKAWEAEGRAALGSRVGEARLCDLDDEQIQQFVRHWYLAAKIATHGDNPTTRGEAESRAVDLIGAIQPERIRKLAATPLMLSILAMVHSRGVGLPQERSQLYHECIEFMLGYWDEVQQREPDSEMQEVAALQRPDKRKLLEPVALWMHRLGSEQIEPLHDDLVREFTRGFELVFNEPKPCAERHARAFLRLVVERGGLMQESEAGQFRFVHLTFQEYLAASAIAHGEAPFAQVQPHLHDPWWREVILLAGGELSRQPTYLVRLNTTAWLTGILNNNTWAERYLLRDLTLAAQSCADMTETGVAPNITQDIARRLTDAMLEERELRLVVDVAPFVRELPLGHLTKAIAAELPGRDTIPTPDGWFPPFALISFLPDGVVDQRLRETFRAARRSKDSDVAVFGAALHILFGPTVEGLQTLAILRRRLKGLYSIRFRELVGRLLAVSNKEFAGALRTDLEADFARRGSYFTHAWAYTLVSRGNEKDQEAGLNQLLLSVQSNDNESRGSALRFLKPLASKADKPLVLSILQGMFDDKDANLATHAVECWVALVEHRGPTADWSSIERIAADPNSPIWHVAALALARCGAESKRVMWFGELERRMPLPSDVIDYEWRDLWTSFKAKEEPAQLAEHLLEMIRTKGDFVLSSGLHYVRKLGAAAWDYPQLVQAVVEYVPPDGDPFPDAVESLALLLKARPESCEVAAPTVAQLGNEVLALLSSDKNAHEAYEYLRVIQTLSSFPELRTAVASGGRTPSRTKSAVKGKKTAVRRGRRR